MPLTVWSFGLVGATYLVFFLRLLQLGYLRAPRELPKVLLLVAVGACSIWGGAGFALVLTREPIYWLVSALADMLRYGAWFAFLLALYRPSGIRRVSGGFGRDVVGCCCTGHLWLVLSVDSRGLVRIKWATPLV